MTAESSTNVGGTRLTLSGRRVLNTCKAYWYFVGGVGLVMVGVVVSTAVANQWNIQPYQLKDGISLFALLFIMAQALERLMEPFTEFVPHQEKPDEEAIKADPALKNQVKEMERQRAVFIWGVTSLLAMLASAYLGVFLLRTIGATAVPLWVDIAITGLAVGAGTKPLHDLIQRIETSKAG